MAALYWKRPSAEELKAFKFKPEHYPEKQVIVYSDVWDAFQLYVSNSTQWRAGSMALIGLDYSMIYKEMDLRGYSNEKQLECMDWIRVLEEEAIKILNKPD